MGFDRVVQVFEESFGVEGGFSVTTVVSHVHRRDGLAERRLVARSLSATRIQRLYFSRHVLQFV